MSLTETISPTIERLRKAQYEAPTVERNVVRRAYRVLTVPEQLAKRGQITREQLHACSKLERHFLGSLGVDVGDDDSRHGLDEVDYAQSYHGQKVADARKLLTPNEYKAQMLMIQTEMKVEDIGHHIAGWSCRKMNKGYGLSLIHSSADRLIKFWGLQTHPG
jgi:hypothetical protein